MEFRIAELDEGHLKMSISLASKATDSSVDAKGKPIYPKQFESGSAGYYGTVYPMLMNLPSSRFFGAFQGGRQVGIIYPVDLQSWMDARGYRKELEQKVMPKLAKIFEKSDLKKLAYTGGLAVEPALQKHGIGTKLVSHNEIEAKNSGYAGFVASFYSRAYSRSILKKQGWVILNSTKTQDPHVGDHYFYAYKKL